MEINLQTYRVAKHEELSIEEYAESMMTRIDEVTKINSGHSGRLKRRK
jgi:hypothetical protein